MNISPFLQLGQMNMGDSGEQPDEGISFRPRMQTPRSLLMKLLKQDPAMEEFLKNAKLRGVPNGSMGTDYGSEGE